MIKVYHDNTRHKTIKKFKKNCNIDGDILEIDHFVEEHIKKSLNYFKLDAKD
jgi:hypothetical protein